MNNKLDIGNDLLSFSLSGDTCSTQHSADPDFNMYPINRCHFLACFSISPIVAHLKVNSSATVKKCQFNADCLKAEISNVMIQVRALAISNKN